MIQLFLLIINLSVAVLGEETSSTTFSTTIDFSSTSQSELTSEIGTTWTPETTSGSATTTTVESTTADCVEPLAVFVTVEAENANSVLVRWNITGCEPDITGFNVTLEPGGSEGFNCSDDEKIRHAWAYGDELNVLVDDLFPFHTYKVSVDVISSTGVVATNVTSVRTLDEDPPPPQVSARGVENRTLRVEWSTGCVAGHLSGFAVFVTSVEPKNPNCPRDEEDHPVDVPPNTFLTTVEQLAPYYEYNVKVTVKTKNGRNASSVVSAETSQEVPPAPNIVISELETGELIVNWTMGNICVPGNINMYNVTIAFKKSLGPGCDFKPQWLSEKVPPDTHLFSYNDTLPYSLYEVSVAAETAAGLGEFREEEFRTMGHVPPPRTITVTDKTPNSFNISWSMDDCINSSIGYYLISGKRTGPRIEDCDLPGNKTFQYNATANDRDYIFSAAVPYSVYLIEVRAGTGNTLGSPISQEVNTLEEGPPPPQLIAQPAGRQAVNISWLVVCAFANITDYTIIVTPVKSQGTGCAPDPNPPRVFNVSALNSSVTVPDLLPFYEYNVSVTVYTETAQNATNKTTVTTLQEEPPAPTVELNSSSSSIEISWSMQGCIPGIISHYNVSAIFLESNNSKCTFNQDPYEVTVGADNDYHVFSNALPYSLYNVTVAAATGGGQGMDRIKEIITDEDVPPAPALTTVDMYSKHVQLKWALDDCVNGTVTEFLVTLIPGDYVGKDECGNDSKKNKTFYEIEPHIREFKVDHLEPYSSYTVKIAASTGAGRGKQSSKRDTTKQYRSDPVRSLKVSDLSFNQSDATVSWDKPCRLNGEFLAYRVKFVGRKKDGSEQYSNHTKTTTEQAFLNDLRPEFSYTISVFVINEIDKSDPESITVYRPAGIPEQSVNLVTPNVYATDDSTTKARFTFPGKLFDPSQGTILYYGILIAEGQREPESGLLPPDQDCHHWEKPEGVLHVTPRCWNPFPNVSTTISYTIGDNVSCTTDYCNAPLKPESKYYITVRGYTESTYADSKYVMFETDSSVNVGLIVGTVLSLLLVGCCAVWFVMYRRGSMSWSDIKSKLSDGKIDRSGGDCNNRRIRSKPPNARRIRQQQRDQRHRSPREIENESETPEQQCTDGATPIGNATPMGRWPTTSRKIQMTPTDRTRDADSTQSAESMDRQEQFSSPETEEEIPVYGGSEDDYKTPPYRPPKILLLRRQLEAQPKPVSVTKFPAHSDYMLEVPSRISNEYQLLQTFSKDIAATESCSAAMQPDNRRKNRYSNILPFDSTRVRLEQRPDDTSSDYINASYIRGYSGEIEYIATQGPKEETCSDFWHMVHQQGVKIIIMLTNLEEGDKVKCYKYFPPLRDKLDLDDLTIRCTTELIFPTYTSRSFQILKGDHQRSLLHLHFREWPDFGCPASAELMLHFVQIVRHQILLMRPCLTLIHCSAGVGRSGTLIAVDILLQHIKEHKKVDIFGSVLTLRRQRMFMVQSEAQYIYVYHCIREALLDPKYLETEKTSTSSLEPIYENIGNGKSNNSVLICYEKLSDTAMRTSSSETV